MQKLVLVILILGFVSCKKYEIISQPLNYKDYQSSIDTTFNYLEDIHILISCGDTSCPPKYGYN